jgi:hypothetical protein
LIGTKLTNRRFGYVFSWVGVMGRKEYRDKALECILLAEEIRDPAERLKMLEMAQQYILLEIFIGTQLARGAPQSPDKPP